MRQRDIINEKKTFTIYRLYLLIRRFEGFYVFILALCMSEKRSALEKAALPPMISDAESILSSPFTSYRCPLKHSMDGPFSMEIE